jgi:uncharacterized protein YoxC
VASVSGWALVAASVFWAVLVAFLCFVLIALFRVLTSTRDMLEDLRRQTTPMLQELNETVGNLNREMDQVDEILSSVKGTTAAIEGITKTVQATVAHPAIRALAVAAGAGRAYQRFRKKE